MLIRTSLNYGAHLAAGLVFGAMAATLAMQLNNRIKLQEVSPSPDQSSNAETRSS